MSRRICWGVRRSFGWRPRRGISRCVSRRICGRVGRGVRRSLGWSPCRGIGRSVTRRIHGRAGRWVLGSVSWSICWSIRRRMSRGTGISRSIGSRSSWSNSRSVSAPRLLACNCLAAAITNRIRAKKLRGLRDLSANFHRLAKPSQHYYA